MARLTETDVSGELLARARGGDPEAQAAIYRALAPSTYSLIRRIVGRGAIADDLFQDTMMTVYERLHGFRGEAPLGAWVRQIAVSKCLMHLRSPWQRARRQLGAAFDSEASHGAGPAFAVAGPLAETLDIERALESLPPTARAVIWLYEVEGYSHSEIACAFGRTVSFSKSQLARAHRRLREWFEPGTDRQPCAPT